MYDMFEVHSCVYLAIRRKLLSSNMRVQNIWLLLWSHCTMDKGGGLLQWCT